MLRPDITVLEGATPGAMLVQLAQHTGSYAGQYVRYVPRGAATRNPTFARLRAAVDDGAATIIAIPTLGRPTHWAALSGSRAAVIAAH